MDAVLAATLGALSIAASATQLPPRIGSQYATVADFFKRFSVAEATQLCPAVSTTGAKVLDAAKLNGALQDASDEINSYISVKFSVPLIYNRIANNPGQIPQPMIRVACDIARYRLYSNKPTDEVTQRFKDALTWLQNISKGITTLYFNPPLTTTETETYVTAPAIAAARASQGVFGDRNLSAMPDTIMHPHPWVDYWDPLA